MNKSCNASDSSNQSPRVEIFQSMWGMTGVPLGNVRWSMEEQLTHIKEAGFSGILHFVSDTKEDNKLYSLVSQEGLKLGISCFARKADELMPIARYAKEQGAFFINVMVKDYFVVGVEAINTILKMYEVCSGIGIPLFIETHRGTITQDLLRTISYAESIPELRFTADLSHYIVAGEFTEANEKLEAAFDKILQKTASIHARISNGEQIQISIGDGKNSLAESYIKWWEAGIRNWMKDASEGDIFPFVVELGPPPYGIPVPGKPGEAEMELYDRWQQALVIKEIAEKLRG